MADDNSSSSDEDYLTLNDSSRDRESLVRKKLLENFYGKSAVAAARPVVIDDLDDDEDDEDYATVTHRSVVDRDDLDSPGFDAAAHTQRHVLHSRIHDLLGVEERLALQVRTLDSTMQTLVYENYSRFIDATDAIRSIGVNVQANETGLKKLSERIQSLDVTSKQTEEALGTLRDQVAEKIRIKRLLSRLDALLKLPQTLRAQIEEGKYRTATRSYISASSILGKHSQGFESLRNIETDCTAILLNMKKILARKLLHWNGRLDDIMDGEEGENEDNLPEPPKTMTEIFECVGTLHILLEDKTIRLTLPTHEDGKEEGNKARIMVKEFEHLGKDELQTLAVGAAARALDRILDAHMIRVQERRFASLAAGVDETFDLKLPTSSARGVGPRAKRNVVAVGSHPPGAVFVPGDYLDAILEVATLYGMSFGASAQVDLLRDLIAEAFSSFLSHVRSLLMEESASIRENNEENEDSTTTEEEISSALTLLVQAVHEMAAGLSLPEVGVNADFCANMVNEATKLTDSMVARQVHQKFNDLRLSIVKDCLLPFASKLVEQNANNKSPVSTKESVARARIVASTTLSDCLQLVDDTIRSILAASGGGGKIEEATTKTSSSSSEDHNHKLSTLLKDAVQEGTKEFADWLAGTLEVLAGGEAGNTNRVVHVPKDGHDTNLGDFDEGEGGMAPVEEPNFSGNNDIRETKEKDQIMNLILSARDILLKEQTCSDGEDAKENHFVLAIAEMCRLAQGSVSENLEQSIAAHLGIGKKNKSRHLFADGGQLTARDSTTRSFDGDDDDDDDEVSLRFRLAASRIFAIYASQKGTETAALLTQDLDLLSQEEISINGPRDCVQYALGMVKTTAKECSGIFEGPCRAGPVPAMKDGPVGVTGGLTSPVALAMKTSLQLDVERMFKEKIVILLHPSEQLEFSGSALLFLMMKVALRAFLEAVLLCSFSAEGFKQVQVDVEFVKLMIPHYINEDFATHRNNACSSLTNLLSDVMDAVAERCVDETCEHDSDLHQESLSILRSFMDRVAVDSAIKSRFVIEEE